MEITIKGQKLKLPDSLCDVIGGLGISLLAPSQTNLPHWRALIGDGECADGVNPEEAVANVIMKYHKPRWDEEDINRIEEEAEMLKSKMKPAPVGE